MGVRRTLVRLRRVGTRAERRQRFAAAARPGSAFESRRLRWGGARGGGQRGFRRQLLQKDGEFAGGAIDGSAHFVGGTPSAASSRPSSAQEASSGAIVFSTAWT